MKLAVLASLLAVGCASGPSGSTSARYASRDVDGPGVRETSPSIPWASIEDRARLAGYDMDRLVLRWTDYNSDTGDWVLYFDDATPRYRGHFTVHIDRHSGDLRLVPGR